MTDDIPQWAWKRAGALAGVEGVSGQPYALDRAMPSCIALARYIAAHEEPPVDPVVSAISEAFRRLPPTYNAKILADNFRKVCAERGLEIREVQP